MVDRPPRHEIELKLSVPPDRVAAVRDAVLGRSGAHRVHLQASYLDTPAFDLAANGIGWRLRREGRQWVQTVKATLPDGGDGIRRLEHNVVFHARNHPVAAAELHIDHPAGVRLAEVLSTLDQAPTERFRTDVWREARTVRVAGGRVELAFDQGEIVAAERRVPICELEIELVSGTPHVVIDTARQWVNRHSLWLDAGTKAQRGVLLARGLPEVPTAKAPLAQLNPTMSVDAALREMTRACLVQIMGNTSAVARGVGGDEHVHQARVGIRKLRSVLREFGELSTAVDPRWSDQLAAVFAGLGVDRDRQVVFADWMSALDEAGAPAIIPPAAGPGDSATLLRDPSFTLLLLDLLDYVHGEPTAADPARELVDVVARRLDELRSASLRRPKRFVGLHIEAQHEIRKELKRLRYVAELTESLFKPKRVRHYVRALEPAQEALGALNDLVVATELFRAMTPTTSPAWFAVGWLSSLRNGTIEACVAPLRAAAAVEPYW